jgi:sulfite reductase alpha subunit-like flavoprotein
MAGDSLPDTDDAPRKVTMLSVSSYPAAYVDATRARIDALIAAYSKLVTTARDAAGAQDKKLDPAIAQFEPVFFNHMVLALDNYFLHRGRNQEGKDGNALNEVRLLCSSLANGDGKLVKDRTIKMDPAKSVLKYDVGDEITLSEDDFRALVKAFLSEIRIRFPG